MPLPGHYRLGALRGERAPVALAAVAFAQIKVVIVSWGAQAIELGVRFSVPAACCSGARTPARQQRPKDAYKPCRQPGERHVKWVLVLAQPDDTEGARGARARHSADQRSIVIAVGRYATAQ